ARPAERGLRLTRDAGSAQAHHDVAVARHLEDLLSLTIRRAAVGEPEEAVAIDAESMRPHDEAVAPLLDDVTCGCELDEIRAGAADADDRFIRRRNAIDVDACHLAPGIAFGQRRPVVDEAI